MTVKVGINGFGRIGRQVLKAIKERAGDTLEVVAINDLFDTKTNASLFKYDSNYGMYPGTVEVDGNDLVIDGKKVKGGLPGPLTRVLQRNLRNLIQKELGLNG